MMFDRFFASLDARFPSFRRVMAYLVVLLLFVFFAEWYARTESPSQRIMICLWVLYTVYFFRSQKPQSQDDDE